VHQPVWDEVVVQCQQAERYNVLYDHEKLFEACISNYVDGLSDSCLQCEYLEGPFAGKVQSCRKECLLGWCKQSCQDCYFPSGAFNYTNPCDGRSYEFHPVDPCFSESGTDWTDQHMPSTCIDSDLEKILAFHPPAQLPTTPSWDDVVTQCQSNTCHISFDGHWQCNDALFSSCIGEYVDGLTGSCLECEARQNPLAEAEANCKAACLLGFCKQSCQDCMFPDGPFNYTNPCDGLTREMKPLDPCFTVV